MEEPRRSPRGLGLAWVLAVYATLLTAIVALRMSDVSSVRTVLYFDLGVLAAGLVLFVAFWEELGPLLALPRWGGWRVPSLAIVVMLALYAVLRALAAASPEAFTNLTASYRDEGESLAMALFQIGPLTALGEELLFRGVLLQGVRSAISDGGAIGLSALMFAATHLSLGSLPHVLALGVLFAWLVVRTGSLWPGIVLHSTWNVVMALME